MNPSTGEITTAPPLRIIEIGTLVVVPPGPVPGLRMRKVPSVRDAVLTIRDGRIAWFGPKASAPPLVHGETAISAGGGCVVPGLIDPHTHISFVGERSGEFVRRIAGETYLSILESGGGIRVTSAAVRAASEEQIVAENLPRLARMLRHGVTTAECKSGYGLAPEQELKQLHAIQRLGELQPMALVPTYLGAHALPAEYAGRPDDYLGSISSDPFLREISKHRLARFCDVFCDRGAFTVDQARRVLQRAARHGLRPKIHADELAQIGASRLAGELQAVSADHLEHLDEFGMAALKAGGVIPVVLPGTSFFLGIPHADSRAMIAADLPVALGTDYNPGSGMLDSLPLIMNIACCQLRLLPEEALVACTANAAGALELHESVGAIAPGFDADLLILNVPNLHRWMYEVGVNATRFVLRRGQLVYSHAA